MKRVVFATFFLLSFFLAGGPSVHGQTNTIDLPRNLDKSRNRNVPIAFHLPKQKDARPLVLFSHGGAASRHGMYALASEVARNGFVVACLEHVTSNSENIRQRMRNSGIGFRPALLESADDMVPRKHRPLDVKFAIDLSEKLNAADPRFKGRMDLSKIAIIGHSYGAYTAMVACGVKPVGLREDLSEPRIKLAIALSPQSANGKFFDQRSFQSVTQPFVGISGTRDISGTDHQDFFRLMPPGDKHLLWFHDASHFSFSDPTGGPRRLPNTDTDVTNALKNIVPRVLDKYLLDKGELDQTNRDELIKRSLGGSVRQIEWKVK